MTGERTRILPAPYFDEISFFFKKDFANNFVRVAFKTILCFQNRVGILPKHVYICSF